MKKSEIINKIKVLVNSQLPSPVEVITLGNIYHYLDCAYFPIGYGWAPSGKTAYERLKKQNVKFKMRIIFELYEMWDTKQDDLEKQSNTVISRLCDLFVLWDDKKREPIVFNPEIDGK